MAPAPPHPTAGRRTRRRRQIGARSMGKPSSPQNSLPSTQAGTPNTPAAWRLRCWRAAELWGHRCACPALGETCSLSCSASTRRRSASSASCPPCHTWRSSAPATKRLMQPSSPGKPAPGAAGQRVERVACLRSQWRALRVAQPGHVAVGPVALGGNASRPGLACCCSNAPSSTGFRWKRCSSAPSASAGARTPARRKAKQSPDKRDVLHGLGSCAAKDCVQSTKGISGPGFRAHRPRRCSNCPDGRRCALSADPPRRGFHRWCESTLRSGYCGLPSCGTPRCRAKAPPRQSFIKIARFAHQTGAGCYRFSSTHAAPAPLAWGAGLHHIHHGRTCQRCKSLGCSGEHAVGARRRPTPRQSAAGPGRSA